ncbi:MAG: TetR/AcrR family transcriptional regulator [Planctomycetota bacterium]|nr:TetR/AcrR family transcriptional regulator [Planctomycetota bacterium]
MATQKARREQTRQSILDAACELFEQRGYDETSVDEIVKFADVAKGTFFRYFPTKLDVLVAVSRQAAKGDGEKLLVQVQAAEDGLQAVETIMRFFCAWFEKNRSLAIPVIQHAATGFLQGVEHDTPSASTRALLTAAFERAQALGQVRTDVKPRRLAEMLSGISAQAIKLWAHTAGTRRAWPWVRQYLDVFLHGALKQAGPARKGRRG